jgi:hypothetical protein
MKKIILSLALCLMSALAGAQVTMCTATSATACAAVKNGQGPDQSYTKTYQAAGVTTAGAGSCVMLVQGSNDQTNYDTIGTISLTLSTTSSSDSFTSADRYIWVRGNPTTLTGTGGSCILTMGN